MHFQRNFTFRLKCFKNSDRGERGIRKDIINFKWQVIHLKYYSDVEGKIFYIKKFKGFVKNYLNAFRRGFVLFKRKFYNLRYVEEKCIKCNIFYV